MPNVIGVVGFLLALTVLVVLICKGMHLAYSAFIAVAIIIITNGMPILQTLSDYWRQVGMLAGIFIPMFLFGAIFAKVYSVSGAASSLTEWFMGTVCGRAKTKSALQTVSIMAMILVAVVLGYGGVDTFAMLFLALPIFASVMEKADIPRRFLPALMSMGMCVAAVGAGAPQMDNTLATTLAGVPNTAGLIPSLIGQATILISGAFYLTRAIRKASADGEHFSWGKLRPAVASDAKRPHPLLALLPLILICGLYNATKLGLAYSMLMGAILCLILFFPYFTAEGGKFRSIMGALNAGVHDSAMPILCLPAFGIGSVIAAAPSCKIVTDLLTSIPGPALVSCAIMLLLLVAICADPKAGMSVGIPIAMKIYTPLGVSPGAIARVGAFSMGVLDTLPIAAGMPMVMSMCDLEFMEGYKPAFWTTVICTGLGTVAVVLVLVLFPGLA